MSKNLIIYFSRSGENYFGGVLKNIEKGNTEVIAEYIEDCKADGIQPEKSYKGSFNVRITPDLHRKVSLCAACKGISLNAAVEAAIQDYVGKQLNSL